MNSTNIGRFLAAFMVTLGLSFLGCSQSEVANELSVPTTASAATGAYIDIVASSFNAQSGIETDGVNTVGYLDNGDWMKYASVDFGSTGAASFTAHIGVPASNAGQKIEIRLDSLTGIVIGELTVSATGGYSTLIEQTASVSPVNGVHDLYLIVRGTSGAGNMDRFRFAPASSGVTYRIDGQDGVVIDGRAFSNANGPCMTISNSRNITIKNSSFVNCGEDGIRIDDSVNINIDSNYFEDTSAHAILAVQSDSVAVTYNRFKNAKGGTFPMFISVGGHSRIANNVGVNEPNKSNPEDIVAINENRSSSMDPLIIENNCFKGGGPSTSGGGLMLGQAGGANIIARNNTLVDPGQYGIGIASGHNIQVLDNKVYAKQAPWNNVGIYVWAQYNASCSDNTVSGNRVNYINASGSQNAAWNSGNCGPVQGWSNNAFGDQSLTGLDCSF